MIIILTACSLSVQLPGGSIKHDSASLILKEQSNKNNPHIMWQ